MPIALPPPEIYGPAQGLASFDVEALLADTEGNLWAAGKRGLDRFRKSVLVAYSSEAARGDWHMCADGHGTVWAGGSAYPLRRIVGESVDPVVPDLTPYGLSCGADGALVLHNTGLYRVVGEHLTRLPPVPGATSYGVRAAVEDTDGSVVAIGTGILHRLKDGVWRPIERPGIFGKPPTTVFIDSHGRRWSGYFNDSIALTTGDVEREIEPTADGVGFITIFAETSRGIFVCGAKGVAMWSGDAFRTLNFVDRVAIRGATGLVEDNDGNLWLNGFGGVVRVERAEFDRWLAPTVRTRCRRRS